MGLEGALLEHPVTTTIAENKARLNSIPTLISRLIICPPFVLFVRLLVNNLAEIGPIEQNITILLQHEPVYSNRRSFNGDMVIFDRRNLLDKINSYGI
jgi:hypothetical protein